MRRFGPTFRFVGPEAVGTSEISSQRHGSVSILHEHFEFRSLVRVVAVGCVAAIGVLSLIPRGAGSHPILEGNATHLVAYAAASLLLAVGVGRRQAWVNVSYLSAAAAVFELAQGWIPGGRPGMDNWVAGSSGAMLGALAVAGTSWLIARHRPVRGTVAEG